MRGGLVTYLAVVHVAAILLFSRGFLLNRLALQDVSKQTSNAQERPQQTHKRAVFLIIDSLRFDFVSPNPPEPSNPYHHNVLTLPAELTKTRPGHSFLFNTYADPPTTTLQRIKALTTGSLPTFVDMGSNFGGSAILEDSIVKQLRLVNKTIAFMGDDTWLSVYPTSFHPNLTFPYDSFNVEDLHTVDTGVLTHLFPLLLNSHPNLPVESTVSNAKQFDFLIGHFLGVDHVGHRVGPSHQSMHAKLTQMDTALRRVVDFLDDDTLLVVLGDHGMDRAGDHGGDGTLETSSALWIYSKGPPLMDTTLPKVFSGLLDYKTFPGTITPWRSVQQIDLLPTLSLLLGLPIPYNNLGTIIPELFWRSSSPLTKTSDLELEKALTLNSQQVRQYLNTYRSSSSGSELRSAWNSLQSAWDAISVAPQLSPLNVVEAKFVAMAAFNRSVLSACRAIWAQFNPVLMAAGLALMVTAILTTFLVYTLFRIRGPVEAKIFSQEVMPKVLRTAMTADAMIMAASRLVGFAAPIVFPSGVPMNAFEIGIFVGPMFGCGTLVVLSLVELNSRSGTRRGGTLFGGGAVVGLLILLLHTVSFFSNSFTFWEDRIVLWLCATSMVQFVLWGAAAPGLSSTSSKSTSQAQSSTSTSSKSKKPSILERLGLKTLRGRILGFTVFFLICIRLMSLVTVCREEQGAYCHVTFYATPPAPPTTPPATPLDLGINTRATGDQNVGPKPMAIVTTSTTPPNWALLLSLPTALILPFVINRILKITKSDSGIAPIIISGVVSPALIGSWTFWMLEWVESGGLHTADTPLLRLVAAVAELIEETIRLRSLRSWIARGVFTWVTLAMVGWWLLPLCLDIRVSKPSLSSASSSNTPTKTQVVILGYANAYGAPNLMFYLLMFLLVYVCTPLPGQVVLGLATVALLSYLEALDGVRDAKEIERVVGRALNPSTISTTASPGTVTATKKASSASDPNDAEQEEEEEPTTLLTIIPLILLSFITFYATGHQSTVSSMQWKTGFVLTESVKYPSSVVSVVMNTTGPFFLLGVGGCAVAGGWKRSPMPSSPLSSVPRSSTSSDSTTKNTPATTSKEEDKAKEEEKVKEEVLLGHDVEHSTVLTILLVQLYFLMLLFGASTSAAVLRRHLMVWKVFAPRFMAAVVEMVIVDLGVCLSTWIVIGRVVDKVGWVLGRVGIGRIPRGSGTSEKSGEAGVERVCKLLDVGIHLKWY